ncbi:MAG: hypothetical protein AB7F09_19610 [Parvibaculaceae bacterium]
MKAWQFHTAPDRRERFARLEPKVWLDSSLLRTWVVADPELIVRVLQEPRAAILSIHDLVGAVEAAYGVEFPYVRFAARHLPLFLDGDAHAERRQRFTRYLAGRLPELEARLPGLIDRHLRPLRRQGEVDLVSEVTGPLVRDINGIFVGRPLAAAADSLNLLDLFALNKSVARFKDLDQRVRQAIEFLDPDAETGELLGERFTALAMGLETLMTMLTEGLYSAFQEGRGEGHVALPAHPIETGVPISYRRAEAAFEMAGHQIEKGDLLRLQLQTIGYAQSEAVRRRIFGVGAHSCVGKHVSLRIWGEIKTAFDAMGICGRVRSCEVTPSHYLLRHEHIHVEVF